MLGQPPKTSSAALIIIRTASRSRAVGQGAVNQEVVGSVNSGDGNQGLVQRRVTSVSDKVVDIGAVGVLIAAAREVGVAGAGDVASLVLIRGLVVVGVQIVVGVHVSTIEPNGGPDGEKSYTSTEGEGGDAGGRPLTGLVRLRRTTSVIATTTVGWLGSATGSGRSTTVVGRGCPSVGENSC